MGRRTDPRGEVAVLAVTNDGPRVHFVSSRSYCRPSMALVESLRRALAVWGERRGEDSELSWPRAMWVQARAGQWEPA